jgi:SAM-dependent methyltransferase
LDQDEDVERDERGVPLPPRRLRQRVSGFDDAARWLRAGEVDARLIRELLQANDEPIEQMSAVLDLGCGCGRVARWWAGLGGPRIYGCDYDGMLTDWCRQNLPFLRVKTNASVPPLPFRGESMELVYAISLFTHLAAEAQRQWFADVARVLEPGGLFLFTVHGERFLPRLDEAQRRRFAEGSLVVLHPDRSGEQSCAAFDPRSYVVDHLLPTAGLELIATVYEDRAGDCLESPMALQDNYLARKPR